MKIITMIKDFEELCHDSKSLGNWKAFLIYYEKYKELFDSMLEHLYMTDLQSLEPLVNNFDFNRQLETVHIGIENGVIEKINNLVKKTIKELDFTEDFKVYMGVGLGHMFGAALKSESPFIYFGLENSINNRLEFLVPHEVNHMVRIQRIENIDSKNFVERMVTEGLGTMCPIIINKMPINNDTLSKALLIPLDSFEDLLLNESEIRENVFINSNSEVDTEIMSKFFMASHDKESTPRIGGYFIGMRIIQKLHGKNIDLKELTAMPSDKIMEMYKEV